MKMEDMFSAQQEIADLVLPFGIEFAAVFILTYFG
jgi:hypothetical protein